MSTPAKPELTGGRRIGVLVVHGFTGSPASMRPWAEDLAARGYAVEMPLLPGHGTRWQDMNKVTWADWVATVEGAFDKLAAENDAVVAVGLSMGGVALPAPRRGPWRGARRPRPGQRRRRHAAQGRRAAARPQALRAGLPRHQERHQEARHGRGRLPGHPAEGGVRDVARLGRAAPGPAARSPIPVLFFRSAEDHVADISSSRRSTPACRPRTSRSGCWRTATTSRASTTTPRGSSRSPPSSSSGSPPQQQG